MSEIPRHERDLTRDERDFLTAWEHFGARMFPVVKRGRSWWWEGWRSVPGCPSPFKTKRDALAAVDRFVCILIEHAKARRRLEEEARRGRWLYAPKYRPPGAFTLPTGWALEEVPPGSAGAGIRRPDLPTSSHRFGVVSFERKLEASEVESYELKPLGPIG